ncbi:MAG: divalent-cation tolerance protein CutA [Deltaproteobacteria bacterium]|nr:divalent-cation tolerance protein CutA [Deltaproteobacteria bacterium]
MKLILSTIPPNEAPAVAKTLVSEQLVASVNIVPAVQSIYTWKGNICDDTESLMIMKTTAARVPSLIERLKALHSYEVPEIVSLDIDENGSNPDYVKWVLESVSRK